MKIKKMFCTQTVLCSEQKDKTKKENSGQKKVI